MKKGIIAIFLTIFVIGCVNNNSTEQEKITNPEKITKKYLITDFSGDDNGPGFYIYPLDNVFVKNSFDLTSLEIAESNENYIFYIKIKNNFKNDWINYLDVKWDVQLFDIYLNTGAGKHKQTLSGRHVIIKEGWDVGILVGPDKYERMENEVLSKNSKINDDISESEDLRTDIFIPEEINIQGNVLEVKISKAKISLANIKSVQVFVLGAESYPTKRDTYNRVVNKNPAQWRFGGGTDYEGDPNVIDILGDNKKLSEYNSTETEVQFPVINMISIN